MKRDRQREAKFCEERVVGVEPIRNNGTTIGLSGAYTRFARTCNSKSWKGGAHKRGAGYGRSTRHKGEVILLGRSLISSSILSRKSVQRPGKVLSFSPNSLCLSAASTPMSNLSLSLSNLIYPEPLLISIVTWIRIG